MKKLRAYFFRYLAIIVLLVIGALKANAQKKVDLGFHILPKFSGFNLKTSFDSSVNGEVTIGYGFGTAVGFNFSDYVGIQAEVLYSSIAQKYTGEGIAQRIKLKYINIPLLLSLNTGKSKRVNVNVVVGAQVGISVGSSLCTLDSLGINNTKAVLPIMKGDVGVAYGAGIDFRLNSSRTFRLSIGFRNIYSLVDISSNRLAVDSYYILDRTHLNLYSAYAKLLFLF